jgi:hypothetical protein
MDDNFEKNLIADFLKTLRNVAGYTGKVVVMDYGMTAATANIIKRQYGVTVAPCVRDRHIFSIRFRDAVKVIADLEDEITRVMLIDGGDVWFQAPLGELFQLCGNRLGCVTERSSADPAHNYWIRRILTHLDRDQARILARNFRGTKNKNAGMICGPRQVVATMAGLIEKYVNRCGVDRFGIDQIFFNFLLNRMAEGQKIMLPERFNYVLIDHEDHLNISDHLVYDQDQNLVNVVHNAGGGYYRVVAKEAPARFNESQYQTVIKITG